MKNLPLSYVELSRKNLIQNIRQLKYITKSGTKVAVAVKGNAYGHGQDQVVSILEKHIDYFIVNSIDELKPLRKISKKETFLLGYVQKSDLDSAIRLHCILSVFSIVQLKEIERIAKKLKIKQEVHLPIDAYLGREGFLNEELPELFLILKKCQNIKLTGIYAHFANIEDTKNFTHAQKQIIQYEEAIKIAEKFGFKNLQTHISATSGLLVYEKSKGINSLIRIGVGVYGLWPSEHIRDMYLPANRQGKNKIELKPVLSWKSKIAEVKNLPKGYAIGYGITYITSKPTKIAIIPQGYADGFDRKMSNNGEVLIKGTRCKILGRIAMNMFVVDISHINNAKEEDEVVLLGRQGKEEITAEELAKRIDTINYEITTKINPLLPRIVKK